VSTGTQLPVIILPDQRIDEALWAAYWRYDKAAVKKELLCCCLYQPSKNGQPMRGATHG